MKRLTFNNVSKAYGGVPALQDVTLSLEGGRVHALMGENGAGKSTLIKLLAGIVPADSLAVQKDGQAVALNSAQDAQRAGFRFIHQELNIVPQVSVAENILLGQRYPRRMWLAVNWKEVHRQARDALSFLGADHIDVAALAGDLSTGDKILIKIAAAFVQDLNSSLKACLYVFDEPTASLTGEESELLFAVIERLKCAGAAILYVSHRLDEVMRICDDVTVLRDGRRVLSQSTKSLTKDQVIHAMTGRDVRDAYPARAERLKTDVIADFSNVATSCLSNLNFSLRAGEILGIAGLSGAGQSQLLEMFMGLHPMVSGHAQLLKQGLPKNTTEAWARGVAYLPSERRSQGLMLEMPIRSNILVPHLSGVLANFKREKRDAIALGQKVRLKCKGIEQTVRQLSGGNQQKVVFARALCSNPKLLLLNEPTRGVDVGAKFDIYSSVREHSEKGCAMILTSSDLPEMLGMCDRILILQNGRQTDFLDPAGMTSADLITHFFATQKVA